MRRSAFTLIEVMVSLVITGLIGLAAYSALDAGLMTRERVDGPLREREGARIARGLLDNALRHRVDRGEDALPLVRNDDATGDHLVFDTRGVEQPYGGSDLWRVEVQGATLSAQPLESPGVELRSRFPGIVRINVSTLGADGWHDGAARAVGNPRAVRIDFVAGPGMAPVPPLVVNLGTPLAR